MIIYSKIALINCIVVYPWHSIYRVLWVESCSPRTLDILIPRA